MTDFDLSKTYSTSLSIQAAKTIDSDTTWKELAPELDAKFYQNDDKYSGQSKATEFEPLFLANLWAKVEDESLSGIPKRLRDRPELARSFGFNPPVLPSESTFRPVRMNDRFEELQSVLETAAKEIREIAFERGAPIGNRLTKTTSQKAEGDVSERTIDRMVRKKSKQVLEELYEGVFPALTLPRPDDAVYSDNELLMLEALASIKGMAANGGGKELGDTINPDPDYFAPFTEDGPSGETLLESIKELSAEEVGEIINYGLKKTYQRAKPTLRRLSEDGKRFAVRANVAIDITYVGYYGEIEGMKWLQGAPEDKEYYWCHKFATVSIVGPNVRFVLGVSPLGNIDEAPTATYPGKNKSYRAGQVVRDLLNVANKYADIRTVYADRAFYAVDVVHTLEQRGLKYVIPAKMDDRIERVVKNFDDVSNGYRDVPSDTELYVNQGYGFYGPQKHSPTNTRAETNIVILPPDPEKEYGGESPQPFVTNFDVDDELSLDRRKAKQIIEKYSQRGGIERSYTSIKESAAYTTSKEFEVRWFHFAFATIIYNLWLLVDLLVQDRIDIIDARTKPRISLKRFLTKLADLFKPPP